MNTHHTPIYSGRTAISRLGLALALLVGTGAAFAGDAPDANADSPTAQRADAEAAPFYEGVWLAWPKMEKSTPVVLTYFASLTVPPTPEALTATGLSLDKAQWVNLIRERLESDPRALADIRREMAPDKMATVAFSNGQMRAHNSNDTKIAPYTVEARKADELVIHVEDLDGSREDFRVRPLGPDGMAVRVPGEGWAWFVRAPAEVTDLHSAAVAER